MIKPIREITDRGGKGWRSYAAITCCDIVGGDSRKFVEWLAMPELMHVGSLIVDDVEDKSVVRRGGPTAHMLYGEAQAINSGTAAYFIAQKLLGARSSSRTPTGSGSTTSTSRRCAPVTPARRSTSTASTT